jgi:hypothetical protein
MALLFLVGVLILTLTSRRLYLAFLFPLI